MQASEEVEQPAKRQRVEGESAAAMETEGASNTAPAATRPAQSQPACLRAREKILAVERDYSHFFLLDVGNEPGADQFVYKHFNGLCVIGVAPSHIAFANGRKVRIPLPKIRGLASTLLSQRIMLPERSLS
jgi:hypothetical protein